MNEVRKSGVRIPYPAAFLGYVSIMIASAGFYGYYLNHPDAIPYLWIVWAFIGIAITGYKHLRLKSWSCALLDLFSILCMAWVPMMPLPFGLSIVGMIVLCSILMAISMKMAGYYTNQEIKSEKSTARQ